MVAAAFNAYQSLRLKQVTKNKSLSLVVINQPLPRLPKAIVRQEYFCDNLCLLMVILCFQLLGF